MLKITENFDIVKNFMFWVSFFQILFFQIKKYLAYRWIFGYWETV